MRGLLVLATVAALSAIGCMGTPTPLAPGLDGTIGVPHHGVQRGAVELPRRGRGFVRYRPRSPNYWGRPHLVKAIEHAAASVAEKLPGGAPLVVGDLSSRDGGKIPGHRSHRTGRDVDLLFFATTPSGAPVPSPGFIHYGTDGLAKVDGADGGYLRLDVERQWLLVKELLQSDVGVQWMFASRSVEALLIDYARARGEDPYLVWRAETMLLEPGDSSSHDDHIHLRVACSAEDALTGCEGGGPYWEWLPELPSLGELDRSTLADIAREDPFDLSVSLSPEPHAGGDA